MKLLLVEHKKNKNQMMDKLLRLGIIIVIVAVIISLVKIVGTIIMFVLIALAIGVVYKIIQSSFK
ncbi:MAG: hypothetical protein KAG96_07680 [Ichthyobacteriaceae bacterium]|nr:hypothetical protein [Ichthyobacteriaceae bacterium]